MPGGRPGGGGGRPGGKGGAFIVGFGRAWGVCLWNFACFATKDRRKGTSLGKQETKKGVNNQDHDVELVVIICLQPHSRPTLATAEDRPTIHPPAVHATTYRTNTALNSLNS
eukprot:scaffold160_cov188-Alexandrium_tamarense.AAC.9